MFLNGKKILLGPSTFALYDKSPISRLIQAGCEVIENPYKRKITKPELLELLSDNVAGLIAGLETLDEDVFCKSKLKVISRCGSGMSNVDLEAARKLGVKVYNTPDGPTTAVAELTLGVMVCMLRMISQMDKEMHEGKWSKKVGFQLEGKTVVIVGFGRIGRKVASLLTPFRVNLLAVDPCLQGSVDGVEIVTLNKALEEADIITIHASGEQQIIGDDEINLLKEGVFLMNIARGNVINESSLIDGLESGKIAGAWLDTFSVEPYNGPLTKYNNVVLTPHIGSYTYEGRSKMEMDAVNNLLQGLQEIEKI